MLSFPLIRAEQDNSQLGHVRREGFAECEIDRAGAIAHELCEQLLALSRGIATLSCRADARTDRWCRPRRQYQGQRKTYREEEVLPDCHFAMVGADCLGNIP